MVHSTPLGIAFAALLAIAPSIGFVDAAFAGSSARSETRHSLTGDESSEVASSRSKSRRASRSSGASEDTVVTQNRGKRSRRNSAQQDTETMMIAKVEAEATDLVAIAETSKDEIAKHLRTGAFEGTTGALALYQLVGKAAAEMPLTPVEMKALAKLTEEDDLHRAITTTETRLIDLSGGADTLDAVAKALGVPRPSLQPGSNSNLGASLVVEADGSNG